MSIYRNDNKVNMLDTEESAIIQASKSLILCLDDEYIRFKK